MIVGLGIDVVDVARFRRLLARHGDRARRRLFTEPELVACDERIDSDDCLAGRFAAKEAALKALGSGKVPEMRWTDLEVKCAASGEPSLLLHGAAEKRADEKGVDRVWVSLSHDAGLACAVVVLEALSA